MQLVHGWPVDKRKSVGAAGDKVDRVAGPALPDRISQVGDGAGETVPAKRESDVARALYSFADIK